MAKTSDAVLRAVKKYDEAHKDNFKSVYLKLNKEKDADILDKLSSVGNVQGYIKDLIRADIGYCEMKKPPC